MSAPVTARAPRRWRHELGGCLHAVVATLLDREGVEPDHVLGAGWSFRYRGGDVRPEEYYFPQHTEHTSLFEAVAPAAGVASRWHTPEGPAWDELGGEIAAGHLPAVAVDNFHLHFRPAYRDVHANHLIVVSELAGDTAVVADPVPPAFAGPIPLAELAAARSSGNPAHHDRDMFFTAHPIRNRWLSARAVRAPMPWTATAVAEAVRRNVESLTGPPDGAGGTEEYAGIDGMVRLLESRAAELHRGADVGDELFVVAGTALAAAAVHADWLRTAATAFGEPRLAEAARAVDGAAHHWTALRILTATSRKDPAIAPRIAHRAAELARNYEHALQSLTRATGPGGKATW